MTIKLKANLLNSGLPLTPLSHFTGSALPVLVTDVPLIRAGQTVTGVRVTVTNADGVETVAPCSLGGMWWTCIFPASLFTAYGVVSAGLKVELVMGAHTEIIAIGDIEFKRSSAEAQPGVPSNFVSMKGGDVFIKSRMVGDVQHYAKQTIRYDEDMGAWGAEWTGEYVLDQSGNFVEVTE